MLRILSVGLWSLLLIGTVLMLTVPVSVEAHLTESIAIIAILGLIKCFDKNASARAVFLALGTALIVQYAVWRITSTLPSPADLQNFIPAIILLSAEMYCILMFGMSVFVVAAPLRRKAAPRIVEGHAPTVDVLVPTYNESSVIVAVTLVAAKAMIYPADKLNVYLLDDGGTDEKCNSDDEVTAYEARNRRASLQKLCAELGVRYLTRERNLHAKAGNLNAALQHIGGDLIVVFDADHAPARDFLQMTVGYFAEDERLFLVQTPHQFINPDPIERNLGTFSTMPSENEMFYGHIQKGLDKWNAAFFCGSAAVLRRAAIDEIGGFNGQTITEDAETALELHSRGWNSVYVDKPMTVGLQPETFDAFIGQRSRWCRGMIQIMLLKNPLFKRGLSLAQRICYISSVLFWFFPFPRLIFMFAPLCYIFFNLKIYVATQQEFLSYTATYMIAALLIQNYLHGRTRWPWVSEMYEYAQSVFLLWAIVGVLVNPRSPKFNVTKKGAVLENDRLSHLAWPYFAIFAVLVAAMVMIVERYNSEPGSRELLVVIGLWNAFNLLLAGVALGIVSERRERRKAQRVSLGRKGQLILGDVTLNVAVENLSFGGMKLRAAAVKGSVPRIAQRATGYFCSNVPGQEEPISVPVRLTSGRNDGRGAAFGVRFVNNDTTQYQLISEFLFADLPATLRQRFVARPRPGVVTGTGRFAARGFQQTLRGLWYVAFRRRNANAEQILGEAEVPHLAPAE